MPITQERMIAILQAYDHLEIEYQAAITQTKLRYQLMAAGPNGPNIVELEQILMDLWQFQPRPNKNVIGEQLHFQRYAKANQSATRRARELRQFKTQEPQFHQTSPTFQGREYGLDSPTPPSLPRRREREVTSKYIYHPVRPQEPAETPDDAPRLDLLGPTPSSEPKISTKVPSKPNLREAALDADLAIAELFQEETIQ